MTKVTSTTSIWLRPARGPRGPAPGYSRAQLATAGVSLADSRGLSAVTMRSVASAVGGAPASLYRYVNTRAELLELMVDQVNGDFSFTELAEPAEPADGAAGGDRADGADRADGPSGDDWMAGMLSLAHQSRAICLRHPWLIEAAASPTHLGPNTVSYLEHALAVLAPVNVSGRTKLEAVAMLSAVVRALTQNEIDQRRAGATVTEWQKSVAGYLAHVVAGGDHPHLAAALAPQQPGGGGGEPESPPDLFNRTVSRVLSGLLLRP